MTNIVYIACVILGVGLVKQQEDQCDEYAPYIAATTSIRAICKMKSIVHGACLQKVVTLETRDSCHSANGCASLNKND